MQEAYGTSRERLESTSVGSASVVGVAKNLEGAGVVEAAGAPTATTFVTEATGAPPPPPTTTIGAAAAARVVGAAGATRLSSSLNLPEAC